MSILIVDSRKQLFIDDRFIQSSQGVVLSVNEARKYQEPVLIADRPWESMCIGGYSTVMEENGLYRLWYEAYASDYREDYDAKLCYAFSYDGIHWEKPALGQSEFQGSRDNNIVFDDCHNFGYHGGTVFKDPIASPEERYKVLYQARGGTRSDQSNACMRGIYSKDGIRWVKYPGILADHLSDTQTVVHYDEDSGRYVGYFRVWTEKGYRAIGRSETPDFLCWPRDPELILAPDQNDPTDIHLYTNGYRSYRVAQDAHIFVISSFHATTDLVDVQLATSRDGISWRRPDRRPLIRLGEEGTWDSGQIYVGAGTIDKGSELWVYYTGFRHGHGENRPDVISYEGKIGIAKIRKDGFMSAEAGPQGGFVMTPLLKFSGSHLELNYDAGTEGEVSVELLGEDLIPIRAFSEPDCDPLHGDSTTKTVTWKGNDDLGHIAGRPTHLRFNMRDAKLFAFHFF